jgi:uncharacterized protein YabN with tetrapyrrole methylase and pyrophosphatase domain
MPLADPPAGEGMQRLRAICAQLRAHCPWDQKQTLESVAPLVVEEGEELRQAALKSDWDNLREEVGDVLFNLLLTVQIAEEQGLFTWSDVLSGEAEKMIFRHPHVYGDSKAETAEEALVEFRRMKSLERNRAESEPKPAPDVSAPKLDSADSVDRSASAGPGADSGAPEAAG